MYAAQYYETSTHFTMQQIHEVSSICRAHLSIQWRLRRLASKCVVLPLKATSCCRVSSLLLLLLLQNFSPLLGHGMDCHLLTELADTRRWAQTQHTTSLCHNVCMLADSHISFVYSASSSA